MNDFEKEFSTIKKEMPHTEIAHVFDELKTSLSGRPLILYGAKHLGEVALDFCKERGIPVTRFCDRNITGNYKDSGIPVITPAALRDHYADARVIICSSTFNDEICADLGRMGFKPEQIIPCPFKGAYFESLSTFSRHFDGYAWAYDFFEDGRSKLLVLDKLRMVLQHKVLEPNTQCECYYEDDFISLGEAEVFVDAGAYTGDSIKVFINKISNRAYRHIYAFEPDPLNVKQACYNLAAYPDVDITAKGLWSSAGEIGFSQNTIASASSFVTVLNSSGKTQAVPVITLDSFFDGMPDNELPTFIKMDIEGAENEALLGATKIIQRTKPKLAICAYHKAEDIYELPQTLMAIRSDYKLALRQHIRGFMDTILYAV